MSELKRWRRNNGTGLMLIGVMLVIMLFLSVRTQSFFSLKNMVNILEASSFRMILALGMMCVIASGAIDLSVGSVLSLTAIIAARAMKAELPVKALLLPEDIVCLLKEHLHGLPLNGPRRIYNYHEIVYPLLIAVLEGFYKGDVPVEFHTVVVIYIIEFLIRYLEDFSSYRKLFEELAVIGLFNVKFSKCRDHSAGIARVFA